MRPTRGGGCPNEQPNGPAANLGTQEGDFLPEPPLPLGRPGSSSARDKKKGFKEPVREKPLLFLLGLGDGHGHGHGGLAAMVGRDSWPST